MPRSPRPPVPAPLRDPGPSPLVPAPESGVLPSGFLDLASLQGLGGGAGLPAEIAAYVALEVCEALTRQGGTSEPSRILVGRDGEVRLGSVWSASPEEGARCAVEVFDALAGPGGSDLLPCDGGDDGDGADGPWTVETLRTHLAAALFPLTREECRAALVPILDRLQRPAGDSPVSAAADGPIQVGWLDGQEEVAAQVDGDAVFAALEAATRAAKGGPRDEGESRKPSEGTGPLDAEATSPAVPPPKDPLLDLASLLPPALARRAGPEGPPTRPLAADRLRGRTADLAPTMAPPRPSAAGAKRAPAAPRPAPAPVPEPPESGPFGTGTESWQPPSLEDLPTLGVFEGLDLLGLVATGGMAQVLLARDKPAEAFERLVAVKRMLPHLSQDPGHLQMFADEAKIGFRLRHPNICHVYEFGRSDGVPYLVMEWVHGVTLSRLVGASAPGEGLEPGVAAHLVSQVASALDYAHRSRDRTGEPLRIVHRDVSPQNVMVSFDGFVKLLDFGVAKAAAQVQRTEGGMVKGKFGYMSPEQCLGLPLDGRSDVFSLGICLYETLTGTHLYHRQDLVASVQSILNDPVPDPRDLRPAIPAAVAEIVVTALQKKPEDRFPSAGAFQQALARFLQGLDRPVIDGDLGRLVRARCGDQASEPHPGLGPLPKDLRTPTVRGGDALSRDDDAKPVPAAAARRPPWGPPKAGGLVLGAAAALGVFLGGWLLARAGNGSVASPPPSAETSQARAPRSAPPAEPTEPAEAIEPAEPAAADPDAPGAIRIQTVPAGGAVRVDGTFYRGRTPLTVEDLAPGTHEVLASKKGYRPERVRVEVPPGGTAAVTIELPRR